MHSVNGLNGFPKAMRSSHNRQVSSPSGSTKDFRVGHRRTMQTIRAFLTIQFRTPHAGTLLVKVILEGGGLHPKHYTAVKGSHSNLKWGLGVCDER